MIKVWLDNPVFQRESLILKRGKIPTLLFIVGPGLLGVLFVFSYLILFLESSFDPGKIQTGRSLFESLIIILFWGIMLIVPAMAGNSISKDRTSGSLSALRLTSLSCWKILFGKCAAFGTFYSLIYFTALPIIGLTLLLGGVAPSELFGVFSITLVCALQCMLLSILSGLFFRRSSFAMIIGFIATLFYLILLPLSLSLIEVLCRYIYAKITSPWLLVLTDNLDWFSNNLSPYFFPGIAIGKVLSPGAIPQVHLGPITIPFWVLTVVGISLTTIFSFFFATLLMRKELWLRPAGQGLTFRLIRGRGNSFQVGHLLDERKNPFWDWESRRHPVLLHEKKVTFLVIAFCVLIVILFLKSLPEIFEGFASLYLGLTSFLIALIPIAYCSQTVVREKEMGTYDSLILTLLQPQQVIRSKMKCCLYYVTPLLVIAAVICFLNHFNIQSYGTYSHYSGAPNPFLQINLVWVAVQLLRCVYYSMLGIFCSLYCRTSLQALAFTIGLEILLEIPYWIIFGIFGCFGGVFLSFLIHPIFLDSFDRGWAGRLLTEYLISLVMNITPIIFMLIVIRILYDRAINLIRFESYRR